MLDYHVLIGVSLGIGFSLLILVGFVINHLLEARAFRKRVCAINTPSEHRSEGERLLHLALKTRNSQFSKYLRDEALIHFIRADQLEHGPYKY
jgi:hypothetical protein